MAAGLVIERCTPELDTQCSKKTRPNQPTIVRERLAGLERPYLATTASSRRTLAAFAASAASAATFPDQTVARVFASALDSASLRSIQIGRPLAKYTGMLRITLPSANGSEVFVLEGRLAGLWAHELLRVAREANQGPAIFDLQEVFYVDSAGEEALRILSRVGGRFITDSAYGKDLCKRLKLRRIAALDVRNSQQEAKSDAHRGGRVPDATTTDPSGADVLEQQRSGVRGEGSNAR